MAHIQDRGKDKARRWQARYRATDGRERTRTFERKVDAERWLATQTADQARGEWVDPALGRMTFGEWVQRWQTGVSGWRRTTAARNEVAIRVYLLPRFASAPLARITSSDVNDMVSADLAAGLASSTVRRHCQVLSVILQAAVLEGRLGRNPVSGVKLPPDESRPMRFLEAAQVRQVAEGFRPHYRPLIYTAGYVGLRWGELVGLRPTSLDLLRKTLTVDQQVTEVSGHLEFGPPKTKAGIRTVTIPGALVDMLGEHLARPVVRDSGLVFPTIRGCTMRRSNFRKLWRRRVTAVFEGTDLEDLVFHELRHTAAALAIAEGAHPLTIKERLGHSSIRVTMDRYGHLFPAQDAALAEALDATLRDSLAESSRNGGEVVDAFPQVRG